MCACPPVGVDVFVCAVCVCVPPTLSHRLCVCVCVYVRLRFSLPGHALVAVRSSGAVSVEELVDHLFDAAMKVAVKYGIEENSSLRSLVKMLIPPEVAEYVDLIEALLKQQEQGSKSNRRASRF